MEEHLKMMFGDINADTSSLKTELTLAIPGERWLQSSCTKSKYSETIDLRLGMGSCNGHKDGDRDEFRNKVSCNEDTRSHKEEVEGWPPVRGDRKRLNYVKVGVDGAPYLRKLNLEKCSSYHQLQYALENLFPGLHIRSVLDEKRTVNPANGAEYVQTYEDKDGDWMLVGDVPWTMFVESCKKMRLVRTHY